MVMDSASIAMANQLGWRPHCEKWPNALRLRLSGDSGRTQNSGLKLNTYRSPRLDQAPRIAAVCASRAALRASAVASLHTTSSGTAGALRFFVPCLSESCCWLPGVNVSRCQSVSGTLSNFASWT